MVISSGFAATPRKRSKLNLRLHHTSISDSIYLRLYLSPTRSILTSVNYKTFKTFAPTMKLQSAFALMLCSTASGSIRSQCIDAIVVQIRSGTWCEPSWRFKPKCRRQKDRCFLKYTGETMSSPLPYLPQCEPLVNHYVTQQGFIDYGLGDKFSVRLVRNLKKGEYWLEINGKQFLGDIVHRLVEPWEIAVAQQSGGRARGNQASPQANQDQQPQRGNQKDQTTQLCQQPGNQQQYNGQPSGGGGSGTGGSAGGRSGSGGSGGTASDQDPITERIAVAVGLKKDQWWFPVVMMGIFATFGICCCFGAVAFSLTLRQ